MKVKKTKRLLALILCMALVLGTNTFTMAADASQSQGEIVQEQENGSQEEAEIEAEEVQDQVPKEEETIEEEPQEQTESGEPQTYSLEETEETMPEENVTDELTTDEPTTDESTTDETEGETATGSTTETTVIGGKGAENELESENDAQGNEQSEDSQAIEAGEIQENGEASGELPDQEETADKARSRQNRQEFENYINEIAEILYGRNNDYTNIREQTADEKYQKLRDDEKQQVQQLVFRAEECYQGLNQYDKWLVNDINNKLEIVREVVQSTGSIIDADEKPVSQEDYDTMLSTMKAALETHTGTNVPITNWRRSESTATVNKPTEYTDWQWEDVADTLLLPVYQDESKVWDGSRLNSEGNVEHQASKEENGGYLHNNQITATEGILYDSATWEVGKRWNDNQATLYRFQGKVHVDETGAARAQYAYTLQQVTGGNEIYVNDDIFVFIYPEGTQITNSLG